jgi:hypothetical protein
MQGEDTLMLIRAVRRDRGDHHRTSPPNPHIQIQDGVSLLVRGGAVRGHRSPPTQNIETTARQVARTHLGKARVTFRFS